MIIQVFGLWETSFSRLRLGDKITETQLHKFKDTDIPRFFDDKN